MKVKGWREDERMVCKGDILLCVSDGMVCEDDGMVCEGDRMVCEGDRLVCEGERMVFEGDECTDEISIFRCDSDKNSLAIIYICLKCIS